MKKELGTIGVGVDCGGNEALFCKRGSDCGGVGHCGTGRLIGAGDEDDVSSDGAAGEAELDFRHVDCGVGEFDDLVDRRIEC